MNEIWKKVTVNSDYEVSNIGNIRSHKHGKTRMLKPFRRGSQKKDEQNKGVYLSVRLLNNGTERDYAVHRLVPMAFIPNPNNYPVVNHKDENPNNNHVENLEWCTQSYNIKYGSSIDRMMHHREGKNKPRGVFVDNIYFRSLLSASKYIKCCHSTIRYKLNEGITEYNGFNIRWAS